MMLILIQYDYRTREISLGEFALGVIVILHILPHVLSDIIISTKKVLQLAGVTTRFGAWCKP